MNEIIMKMIHFGSSKSVNYFLSDKECFDKSSTCQAIISSVCIDIFLRKLKIHCAKKQKKIFYNGMNFVDYFNNEE